ncbi:MAG: discoidin domain-containing protein [Bacteroidales bacterium]|nr:discoidin domain-containing protein [Bacteroidales bacterium]
MHKIIFFLSLVFVIAFCTNCNKDSSETDAPTMNIEMDNKVIHMYQQEGSYEYIPVISNTSWTVTSNVDWLTIEPASGLGSNSVKVEATNANTGEDVREATITIATENGNISHTVQVTQLGLMPNILLNVSGRTEIDPLGGDYSIIVTASGEWSVGDIVLNEDTVWIKTSKYLGRRAYFDVAMNATDSDRETDLTFYLHDTDLKAEVTVNQAFLTQPRINQLPKEGQLGRSVRITGVPLRIVSEVWFGETQGIIDPLTKTNTRMDVLIPKTAERGNAIDVKIVYGSESFSAGTMKIFAIPEATSFSRVVHLYPGLTKTITLEGEFLDLVDYVMIGDIEADIDDGRTDSHMSVTLPPTEAGLLDLVLQYDNGTEVEIGNILFTKNLALYANSNLTPATPRITQSSQGNGGGGRQAANACDGVIDGTTSLACYALFGETPFEAIYTGPTTANCATGRTYWQVNSSAKPGELSPTGPSTTGNSQPPWIMLNFSETTGFSTQPGGYVTFNRIEFIPREGTSAVQQYTIEVSDDNNVWSKILSAGESTPFDPGNGIAQLRTHTFNTPVTTKYIRWVVTKTNGTNNTGLTHLGLYYDN